MSGLWAPSVRLLHIIALEMEAVSQTISHWWVDLNRYRVTGSSTTVTHFNRDESTLEAARFCEKLDSQP